MKSPFSHEDVRITRMILEPYQQQLNNQVKHVEVCPCDHSQGPRCILGCHPIELVENDSTFPVLLFLVFLCVLEADNLILDVVVVIIIAAYNWLL